MVMDSKGDRGRWWLLIMVFILAGVLRFAGVYPGYGPYHPDEGKAGYASALWMFEKGKIDPLEYTYPTLVPLVVWAVFMVTVFPVAGVYKLLSGFMAVEGMGWWETYKAAALATSDVTMMYAGRYLAAVVSLATVLMAYWVGRKLFKSWWAGFFAALVLAVNYRATMAGHFDLPDAYNAFFLLVSLWLVIKMWEDPSWKRYILSGLGMAASFSVKLQFFSFLPFVLSHLILTWEWRKKGGSLWFFLKRTLVVGVVFGMAVFLINFSELMYFEKFFEKVETASLKYGLLVLGWHFPGLSYLIFKAVTWPVVLLAGLGAGWGFRSNKRLLGLLLCEMVAMLLYFLYLTAGANYPRNFVTVMPFFAILVGGGLSYIRKRFEGKGKLMRWSFVLFVVLILGISVKDSIIQVVYYMRPWGVTVIRSWLRDNMEEGKKVAAHPTERHIIFYLGRLIEEKKIEFLPLDLQSSYSAAELAEAGADVALINLDIPTETAVAWWLDANSYLMLSERLFKPVGVSKNMFAVLALREHMEYTLFYAVKPWQAVDNNYVYVRVPKWEKFDGKLIKSYGFDSEEGVGLWKAINGFRGGSLNLDYDAGAGRKAKGSLTIRSAETFYPVVRWVSPLVLVWSGKVYRAEVWVRSKETLKKENRDGFLRWDFYGKDPWNWDAGTESESVTLSERYYGNNGEWKKLVVYGRAPRGVRYASLSFQVSDPGRANFWIDDVEIFESRELTDLSRQGDEVKWVLDDDVLMPNLGSNY